MNSPEIILITLNLIIITNAYFILYPKVVKKDMRKLSSYDFLSSIICLIGACIIYFGTGVEFDIIVTYVNWFWFSIISYGIIEIPFVFWYIKRYNIKLTDFMK